MQLPMEILIPLYERHTCLWLDLEMFKCINLNRESLCAPGGERHTRSVAKPPIDVTVPCGASPFNLTSPVHVRTASCCLLLVTVLWQVVHAYGRVVWIDNYERKGGDTWLSSCTGGNSLTHKYEKEIINPR